MKALDPRFLVAITDLSHRLGELGAIISSGRFRYDQTIKLLSVLRQMDEKLESLVPSYAPANDPKAHEK